MMKSINSLLITVVIIIFGACGTFEQKVDLSAETIAIEEVLESYVLANENQDFGLIEKIWAPNTDIILYGTDSDERLTGWTDIRDAIKSQFQLIEETYISASDQYIKISDDGKTAWFAETLDYNFVFKGEARSFEGLRFTGVIVKMNGDWRFVQAHLSLASSVNVIE